jgi:hypothetical protein
MLRVQKLVPRVPPRVLAPALRAMSSRAFVHWSFNHYLNVAHPSFARRQPTPAPAATVTRAAA